MCRDAKGNPNGILWETAMGLVSRYVPKADLATLCAGIQAATRELASYGVTGACEPGVSPLVAAAYRELDRQKVLDLRCQVMALHLNDEGSDLYPLLPPYRSNNLRMDTVKYFADGGLSGGTAAISRFYKDQNSKGVLRLTREQINELTSIAFASDYSVAVHAIGDEAIDVVIDSFRDTSSVRGGRSLRIEHCGLPTPKHIDEILGLDIGITTQPIFVRELGVNFRKRIDDEFLARCYPVRDLIEAGVRCGLSTDAPVVDVLSPWEVIKAGMLRQDAEGVVIAADQRITIAQGIYGYTEGSADVCGLGSKLGRLEIGAPADLAIWKGNPLNWRAEDLAPIRAEYTFVNGKSVYENPSRQS